MSQKKLKRVKVKSLKMDPIGRELAESPAMEPYIRVFQAIMTKADPQEALAHIAALPLEQRYIWRVVSALKWALADFDSATVGIDLKTLSPEDQKKVVDLLGFIPVQFCMFLKALLGEAEMERVMLRAVADAKDGPAEPAIIEP